MMTLLLTAALAQVQPIDVSEFRGKLQLLTDGKGHYVALDPAQPYDGKTTFYSPDGKSFSQLRIVSGGKSGDESWSFALWDPRARTPTSGYGMVQMKDSGAEYLVSCRNKESSLTVVKKDVAAPLLAAATFTTPLWWRLPEKLLRDESGTYYLIDRFRSDDADDRRDFRIFAGKKGAMKQLPLKDIVDDSKGMVFATRGGDLRLVADSRDGKWVKGKATTALIDVPLDSPDSARLIYVELGPYLGQRLGTPCDDMM